MQAIDYPPVQQALDRLRALSADAETRHQALVRERALFEEATALHEATAIGEARGEARGKIEGKIEGKAEEAIKMLSGLINKRFGPLDDTTRARLHSATLDQLENWADRILDAPTLVAVFDAH